MRTVVAVALVALGSQAAAAAAPRGKIAVTEIRSVQGVAAGTATILSDIVVSEVARAGWDVISQSDITAMIGFEKQKKVLGCSDDSSCLAEIGGALGVDYMLAGQVGQIGSRYRISLLLVDARKAKVAARAAQFCDQNEDALARAAESTVGEILASVRAGIASQAKPSPGDTRPPGEVKPSLQAMPSESAKAAPLPTAVAAAPAETGRKARGSRKAAFITMGSGGAVLLTGAIMGRVAKSRYDALDEKQGEPGYYEEWLAKKGGIRRLAFAADVLMVSGLAASGVGGWLWWRAEHPRVAVLPVASADGVALVALGRF